MELPRRERGDELLKPGEMTGILRRLRSVAHNHDLTTVIACAFDHRTRMLPFSYADRRMVPGGVRAIGSVLVDARVTTDDVDEIFGTRIDSTDVDTVGGYVYHSLGRIPQLGDVVVTDHLHIEVVSILGRRLRKLRIQRLDNNGTDSTGQ